MNKSELVSAISSLTGETKIATERTIDAMGEVMKEAAASGESVMLVGIFGMTVSSKEARPGRNPATGEEIQIPARNSVKFKAGKALVDAANGK